MADICFFPFYLLRTAFFFFFLFLFHFSSSHSHVRLVAAVNDRPPSGASQHLSGAVLGFFTGFLPGLVWVFGVFLGGGGSWVFHWRIRRLRFRVSVLPSFTSKCFPDHGRIDGGFYWFFLLVTELFFSRKQRSTTCHWSFNSMPPHGATLHGSDQSTLIEVDLKFNCFSLYF